MTVTPVRYRYVDAHCHLGRYPDREGSIAAAARQGVLTVAATSKPSEYRDLRTVLAAIPGVEVGLGFHPEAAASVYQETELAIFGQCAADAYWISEVGLDGVIADRVSDSFGAVPAMAAQQELLEALLTLAGPGHPYSVHSRGAAARTLDVLAAAAFPHVVLHNFEAVHTDARRALDLGYYFSVNLASLEEQTGRDFARWLPVDRILTETDGPFVKTAGIYAAPADCRLVVERLAVLRGQDYELLANQIADNYSRFAPVPVPTESRNRSEC